MRNVECYKNSGELLLHEVKNWLKEMTQKNFLVVLKGEKKKKPPTVAVLAFRQVGHPHATGFSCWL